MNIIVAFLKIFNFAKNCNMVRKRNLKKSSTGKSARLIPESLKSAIGIIDINSVDAANEFEDCKIAVFIASTAVISSCSIYSFSLQSPSVQTCPNRHAESRRFPLILQKLVLPWPVTFRFFQQSFLLIN